MPKSVHKRIEETIYIGRIGGNHLKGLHKYMFTGLILEPLHPGNNQNALSDRHINSQSHAQRL